MICISPYLTQVSFQGGNSPSYHHQPSIDTSDAAAGSGTIVDDLSMNLASSATTPNISPNLLVTFQGFGKFSVLLHKVSLVDLLLQNINST